MTFTFTLSWSDAASTTTFLSLQPEGRPALVKMVRALTGGPLFNDPEYHDYGKLAGVYPGREFNSFFPR